MIVSLVPARLSAVALVATGLAACAYTTTPATSASSMPDTRDQFIGIYNGNSFETAMGMRLTPDGRWEFGLSVGALDLRGKGYWEEAGGVVTFTSDPKPIAPEFGWSGYEKTPGGPLLKITRPDGEPFGWADVRLTCSNGARFFDQVPAEGWSPPKGECDRPAKIQLRLPSYDIVSDSYDLIRTFTIGPDETIVFTFTANDLGVADFTEAQGRLVDGTLIVDGPRGELRMQKMPPRPDE